MGKTVLGINIAEYAAISMEKPALIFSLEMSNERVLRCGCFHPWVESISIRLEQVQLQMRIGQDYLLQYHYL